MARSDPSNQSALNKHLSQGGEPVARRPQSDDSRSIINKLLPAGLLDRQSRKQFCHDNGRIASAPLPGICTFSLISFRNDNVLLERPFIKGKNINEAIHAGDVREIVKVGLELANAIKTLHAENVLHQNIKPSNVFIDESSRVVIVDGLYNPIASGNQEDTSINIVDMLYASPEQLGLIQHETGPWSDLYSIGILLYELLAGRPPFQSEDASSVIFDHVSATVRPFFHFVQNIPPSLNELVLRLLKKHPGERYQTAESLVHDLTQIQSRLDRDETAACIPLGTTDFRNHLTEPSFVGRFAELRCLLEVDEDTRSGDARQLIIESESGCGKSRLLDEFRNETLNTDSWLLTGSAVKESGNSLFNILDGVVEGIVTKLQTTPNVQLSIDKEFRQTLSQAFPALRKCIPDLAKIEEGYKTGPEAFAERRNINAFCHLLCQLASKSRPIVLVLDDCHLVGKSVQIFARQLQKSLDSQPPGQQWLSTIISFASDDPEQGIALRNISVKTHLYLSPFDEEKTKELACSMAGVLPPRALELVLDTAAGNPLMITAVVRGMFESEALIPKPCVPGHLNSLGWDVDENKISNLQSSSDAGDFLAARINFLSQELFQILAIGAVLGKSFETECAGELLKEQLLNDQKSHLSSDNTQFDEIGLPDVNPDEMFKEAQSRQLIWLKNDGKHASFIHDKIRAAVLDRLDSEQLKTLNLHAGNFLRINHPRQTANIAIHFNAADSFELAFRYSYDAAIKARARNSLETASRLFSIAWRALTHGKFHKQNIELEKTRLDVIMGLGEVQLLQGKYDAANDAFLSAEELARADHERAKVQGKLGELAFKRGEMNASLQHHTSALKTLGRPAPGNWPMLIIRFFWESLVQILHSCFPKRFLERKKRQPSELERLHLHLLSRYGHACWFAASKFHCLWAHLKNMNLAETFTPTQELAQTYSDHAPAMSLIPYLSRGLKYGTKSLELRSRFADRWGKGQSLHYLGIVLFAGGRFKECIASCKKAVQYLEQTGDYWEVHIARFQIAASHYYLGDLTEAKAEAQRIHDSGIELGDHQASGISLDILSRAGMGNIEQEILDDELCRERVDTQGAAQLLLGQGVKNIAEGDLIGAEKTFRLALASSRKSGNHNAYVIPNYAWLATTLRLQAEQVPGYAPRSRSQLLKRARNAIRIGRFMSWPMPHIRPHLCRERALIYAMVGKPLVARRYLNRSIKIATKLGASYEKALSEYFIQRLNQITDANQTPATTNTTKPKDSSVENDVTERPPFGEELFRGTRFSVLPKEEPQVTVSLADRFNVLLSSGRQITTALDESSILSAVQTAALRLIRGQRSITVGLREHQDGSVSIVDSELSLSQMEMDLVRLAIEQDRSVSSSRIAIIGFETQIDNSSVLASPIRVRGKHEACLLVVHDEISGLFRETEEKLGDFVATLAGAALENADGFKRLEELNASLESRVDERTAELNKRAMELANSNKKLKAIAFDLTTAQVELEKAKSRVEIASQAKSDFLATMSHEIRTPMNAVIGMTQMCLDTPLSPVQKGYLGTVKHSAQSLMRILNDILDLSKIEAGKMDVELIDLNLRSVVENSCQLMAVTAYPKGLELVMHVDDKIPQRLQGDPGRLQQIFINLIGNAIKFTESGHVCVTASLNGIENGFASLRFTIADTGIGILKDKLNDVFGSFNQADSSTTRKFGGTGLGLSICRRLVELMNGKIWVESEHGKGSEFIFEVNLPTTAEPHNTVESQELILEEKTVCVISEKQVIRNSLRETIENFGATRVIQDDEIAGKDSAECDLILFEFPNSIELDADQHAARNTVMTLLARDKPLVVIYPKGFHHVTELANNDRTDVVFLAKPAMTSVLRNAIQTAIGMSPQTEQVDNPSIQEKPKLQTESLRILLAEDVDVNRQIACNALERMGHNIRIAENGLRAIEEMDQHDFDLILMDVEMPEMDGVEATRQIRKTEKGRSIPIVAMTAHVVPQIKQACRNAGMNDYITKPLELDKLESILNQVASEL